MLKTITQSPYLSLLSGLILLITSGYETWDSLEESTIGLHHGVLIFSLIHIAKSIPDILEGLKEVNEADELIKEKFS